MSLQPKKNRNVKFERDLTYGDPVEGWIVGHAIIYKETCSITHVPNIGEPSEQTEIKGKVPFIILNQKSELGKNVPGG